jgi:hypothetical protein
MTHRSPILRGLLLLVLLAYGTPGCNSGADGRPAKKDPASPPAGSADAEPAPAPDTPRGTYETLRHEILQGNFIALYDYCSQAYVREKFSIENTRARVASIPGLADLGLSAQDLARMKPREVIATYFRLFPKEQKEGMIVAMSKSRVLGESPLPDGRVALDIDSEGTLSRLVWVQENGEWKIAGEEAPKGKGK